MRGLRNRSSAFIALALIVRLTAGETPAVIQAALDHYVEGKCRSGWADLLTLVSDVSVRPYFGHERQLPVSPLGVIPEALVRELSQATGGERLALPDPLFFPFGARMPADLPVRGGIMQFSEPAFSPEGDAAVIYMVHSCGDLCAEGSLLYLEKKRHGWVVVRELPLWIS